jgi:hypothetical protein
MYVMHRCVSAIVAVTFFFATTGIASAQGAVASAPVQASSNDTMAAGLIDGEMLAEGQRTGGKLGAGLGVGVLTGLIGTGVGYFVIGPEPLSAEALQRGAGRSADYQLGLKTGWERKTRSKRRNAFLAGGLLGTAAFVAMFVALAEPQ